MEASRTLQRPVLGDAVFDRLVRAHRGPLERYVRGLGASREDAEEIAATALLRAYQSPPAAHRESEWRAWLRPSRGTSGSTRGVAARCAS